MCLINKKQNKTKNNALINPDDDKQQGWTEVLFFFLQITISSKQKLQLHQLIFGYQK